ncbi:transcription factor bHLH90 isoform X2 [Jatropha curcas]|uniref:transcription factor bHLH90 isoform X2 n=1 Tax=Jatropha curcas TaxID=180498 RepID=UPI0009D6EBC1|nr:transcription factor bHLH90 isoform X2 [Jatropha curcas]
MRQGQTERGLAVKIGDMRGLERAVELLRPFVDSKAWDCCVVWKLGDDPSSGGGGGDGGKVKEERIDENVGICRDLYFKHPIRTKACEALACFPSFMPLYSGIHGEVVLSKQSKWVTRVNASDSKFSHESIGTRVLIPVSGGLIELFAGKHIPKDQKIIEFITSQFNVLKQEVMIAHGFTGLNELCLDPFLEQNMQNLPKPCQLLSLIPQAQVLHPLNQTNTHSSFVVSSSGSSPPNGLPSLDSHSSYLPQTVISKQSIGKRSAPRKSKKQAGLLPECNNKVAKVNQRSERDQFRSKNLVTERNRRDRIRGGLFTLRSLVPKITKMDKASTLGDAINYIVELEEEAKKLQDELKETKAEECKSSDAELLTLKSKALQDGSKNMQPPDNNQDFSGFGENKKIELQLEINQIGKREFLIRVLYEKKQGGFGRLMDAIHSLGLQVVDANMTTFNGKVLNILRVEADEKEIQPKKLKESLLKLGG